MTTTAHTAKEIRDHLESEAGPMKEFLRELVSMESPSRDLKALEKIMHFLESAFNQLGYYTLAGSGKGDRRLPYMRGRKTVKSMLLYNC